MWTFGSTKNRKNFDDRDAYTSLQYHILLAQGRSVRGVPKGRPCLDIQRREARKGSQRIVLMPVSDALSHEVANSKKRHEEKFIPDQPDSVRKECS
jgi:hypothetical protein